jgi:hypothetical protein
MTTERTAFRKRLRRLVRQHEALSHGYETRIRRDGLLIVTPKRQSRGVSLTAIVTFLGLFLVLKAVLVAQIGLQGYEDRVFLLQSGTVVERIGAMIMQVDPVTAYLADIIRPLLP